MSYRARRRLPQQDALRTNCKPVPRRRRPAILEPLEERRLMTVFIVSNTNDVGIGSLRQAIIQSNATHGADMIQFDVGGGANQVIQPLSPLPSILDPVVIDATTQPGYQGVPLVQLDGSKMGAGDGLLITAGGSTVKGLSIVNFHSLTPTSNNGAAIHLMTGDGNTVTGNYIGIGFDGFTPAANSYGVLIDGSDNNHIGGTAFLTRNVIAGNTTAGITVGRAGGATTGNTIEGNFIGTDANAATVVGTGNIVEASLSFNGTIGGATPASRNVIVGGLTVGGSGNKVLGNFIGTDGTGTTTLGTGAVNIAGNNTLGDPTGANRNVIATAVSADASAIVIGNFIGTDATGRTVLNAAGLFVNNNVRVEGNVTPQVTVNGNANVLVGNLIGPDAGGVTALAGAAGLTIHGSSNTIGGVGGVGVRNVISGNTADGILITPGASPAALPSGNTIIGNYVGLNINGGPLPNAANGVSVNGNNNAVGGTQPGRGNLIAGNNGSGVYVFGGAGNAIRENQIFNNGLLGIDLGTPGVTPNDPADADAGPNTLQNFPVLTGAAGTPATVNITGTLSSRPSISYAIDFFANDLADASGFGEGQRFIGTTTVVTDASGNATFNAPLPVIITEGTIISATATDATGNTSEFSQNFIATNPAGLVQFDQATYTVAEGGGAATVNIVRTGQALGTVTVDFTTTPGTATANSDYTPVTQTITFASGQTTATVTVPIIDDPTPENDETVNLVLSNATNGLGIGPTNPAVLTITDNDPHSVIVTAAGAGTQPVVRVFDAATGQLVRSFLAYDAAYTQGVRLAMGDVNGDGVQEVITATALGSDVRIYDWTTGTLLAGVANQINPYNGTTGGVYVACADVNGDGKDDIITGPGGNFFPLVQVFNAADGSVLNQFMAYDATYTGGVRVAGRAELIGRPAAIITAPAGPGVTLGKKKVNGLVRVFQASNPITQFIAYKGLKEGINVAAGDVDGDGRTDVITSVDNRRGSQVQVFNAFSGAVIHTYTTYDPAVKSGPRLAMADVNGDGLSEIITAPPPGVARPVRVYAGNTPAPTLIEEFFPESPDFPGGIYVAAARVTL